MRRGVASANARWGNSVAVLTGDFLFARASHILADLGPEAVRIQAEAFERLVTGQILETAGPRDGRDPVEHYLDVLARQDRLAGRRLVPLRRDDVRRRRDGRRHPHPVRRAARRRLPARRRRPRHRLRLATSPARPRAPTCARASPRCRCCGCASGPRTPAARRRTPGCANCSTATSPTTPGSPRRCACCAAHPALEQARRDTVRYAEEARGHAGTRCRECGPKAALAEPVRRGGRPHHLTTGTPPAPAPRRPGPAAPPVRPLLPVGDHHAERCHRRGFGAAPGGPDPAADRPRARRRRPGWGTREALLKTVGELAAQGALPDVVVADVRMPPTHTDEGVRAAVQLRRRHPEVGVLVLSQYVEEQYATELLGRRSPGRRLSAEGPGGRGPRVRGRGGAGGRRAVRRWTPRWSRSCSAAAASRTCWRG